MGTLHDLVFRLTAALVRRAPEAVGLALALLLADVAYLRLDGVRRVAAANLDTVLPATPLAQRRRILRGVFRTAALSYLGLLRAPAVSPAAVLARTSVRHLERFEAAQAGGRGVIVVSAHLGPFDAMASLATAIPRVPATVVMESLRSPRLRDLTARLRASHGLRIALMGAGAEEQCALALRRGETVVMAIDRDVKGDGMPLPFFGRTTTVQPGPATLAERTGATILPIFAWHEGFRRFVVEVEEPVPLVRGQEGRADVPGTMRAVLAALERAIAAHPDQWIALQPVWRDRPAAARR